MGSGSVVTLFLKEVVLVGHGLELKVVIRRILEEHRLLLSSLAFEPQMRLYDELDVSSCHSFS